MVPDLRIQDILPVGVKQLQSLTLYYELVASGKASARRLEGQVAPAIVISPPPIKKMRSFDEEMQQSVLQARLRRDSMEDSKSAFSNNVAFFEAMKHSNTRSNGFATGKSQWSNPVKTPEAQQPIQSAGQSLLEAVTSKTDSTDRKESSNPVVPSSHSLLAPQDLVKKLPSTEVKKLNGIYQLLQKNDHKYGHASFSSGGQVTQPIRIPVIQVERTTGTKGVEQGPVNIPVNLIKRKGAELSS